MPHRAGARFVIRLPSIRSHTPIEPTAEPKPDLEEPAIGAGVNILFVDDEPSAVSRSATSPASVTMSSWRRTAMKRSSCCRRVASTSSSPICACPDSAAGSLRVPLQDRFLFMSGDIVNEKTRRFLASTGRPYLHKPFELKRLASLIRTIADEPPP